MREVRLFVEDHITSEYQLVDLSKDESIIITQSIQNYKNLDAVFTDYSQSFLLPESSNNKKVFKFWERAELLNGFDHKKRAKAVIMVGNEVFKVGQIQLENAINGYNVTFYGLTKNIKDVFKNDKLKDLDYSSLQIPSSISFIRDLIITTANNNLSMQLYASDEPFTYKDGGTGDVTTGAHKILHTELFPAVRVEKLFDFIYTKYGIDFTGSFLTTNQFTKLWLYCKNKEKQLLTSFFWWGADNIFDAFDFITYSPFTIGSKDININTNWSFPSNTTIATKYVRLRIACTSTVSKYSVYVYADGVAIKVFKDLTTSFGFTTIEFFDTQTTVSIKIVYDGSTGQVNMDVELTCTADDLSGSGIILDDTIVCRNYSPAGYTVQPYIDLSIQVPDITVIDFVTGLLKMFNLVVVPQNENTFELIKLNDYYDAGSVIDITPYVVADSIEVSRPEIVNPIKLKYQKSENFLNAAFLGDNNLSYGDLEYDNPASDEKKEYSVTLPFENPMSDRTISSFFQTTTFINSSLKPYVPKPVLIYDQGLITPPLSGGDRINLGSSFITTYRRFANEIDGYSLNWGQEISTWSLNNLQSSLFEVGYRRYIDNLFNKNTRVVKVKTKIPYPIFSQIKLNDSIIVMDKKYIINTMQGDITTDNVTFELLTNNEF